MSRRKKFYNVLYVDDSDKSRQAEQLLRRHHIHFRKVKGLPQQKPKSKKNNLPLLLVGSWELVWELVYDIWGEGKGYYSIEDFVNFVEFSRGQRKEH